MRYPSAMLLSFLVILSGCSVKSRQSNGHEQTNPATFPAGTYWRDVNEMVKSELTCPGKVLPLHYRLMETDYAGLRKLLLVRGNKPGALNLDTIILSVPLPQGGQEKFSITQVQVLPPELADKYPEIKTYHGKSLVYPEDIIRLDISPGGISMMIMSTRGTIMMDPFCRTDSIHVISYFKKDLPEGEKEDFEK